MIDTRMILKCLFALLAIVAGGGSVWWYRARCNPRPAERPKITATADPDRLFNSRCSQCHGRADGTSLGQFALFRDPWPTLTRDRFNTILEKGIPGKMLPHPGLSEEERDQLHETVLSLQARSRRLDTIVDGAEGSHGSEILSRVEGIDSSVSGRPAIIYCFSPDCLACWGKLPALDAWAIAHPGVDVVTVCQGQGAEAILGKPGLTQLKRVADATSRTRYAWDTATSPTILLIDEFGRVRSRGHEWKMPGRPVSRVLFPGLITPSDGHFSSPTVARRLVRPTREY